MVCLIMKRNLKVDKEYILARIKAHIAKNYWKNEGWYSVLLTIDNQVTESK
jgi:hypothetical protein